MADPFVAEIRIFPFNFAPRGWAFCSGQVLPISQNTALFSLLGTTYGGDGINNFSLPNLQGRFTMAQGQSPGLSLRDLGETGGQDSVTLQANQVPPHTHQLMATASTTSGSPTGNGMSQAVSAPATAVLVYRSSPANKVAMATDAVAQVGGRPHNNLQPYLTMNFCIALQGVFPPRG